MTRGRDNGPIGYSRATLREGPRGRPAAAGPRGNRHRARTCPISPPGKTPLRWKSSCSLDVRRDVEEPIFVLRLFFFTGPGEPSRRSRRARMGLI